MYLFKYLLCLPLYLMLLVQTLRFSNTRWWFNILRTRFILRGTFKATFERQNRSTHISKLRSWVVLLCMTLDRLLCKSCHFPRADIQRALWQYTRVKSRKNNVTRGHGSEEIPQNRCQENPCSQPPGPPTRWCEQRQSWPRRTLPLLPETQLEPVPPF